LTGSTPPLRAGVMGWPISHSLSPTLHRYWLKEYGVVGDYLPFAVPPDELEAALRNLPSQGYKGVNVTVPHKENAMKFCDELDEPAQRVGAVNMVSVTESGGLAGRNTDGIGFLENLRFGSKWQSGDGPAVVLGAGGASRAIVASLVDVGVPAIFICNRTHSRSELLADFFGKKCTATRWLDRNAVLGDASLLVNTTSLGMLGQPSLEIDLSDLSSGAVVNDIVYAPLETRLLAAARAHGNPVVDGLGMLLYQARPAFQTWFGVMPEVSDGLRRFIQKKLDH
jgi:shikimate dehydrogenase